MEKYEYTVMKNLLSVKELNALGIQGWAMTAYHEDGRGNHTYYFKRKLNTKL